MHRCNSSCRDGHHYHPSAEASYQSQISALQAKLPNPDKFEVKDVFEYGSYKVLVVHYPGCTNFKGDKCMVAECSMLDLVKAKRIDPHFDDIMPSSKIKIIARFPPNAEGVAMAKQFAQTLQEKGSTPQTSSKW